VRSLRARVHGFQGRGGLGRTPCREGRRKVLPLAARLWYKLQSTVDYQYQNPQLGARLRVGAQEGWPRLRGCPFFFARLARHFSILCGLRFSIYRCLSEILSHPAPATAPRGPACAVQSRRRGEPRQGPRPPGSTLIDFSLSMTHNQLEIGRDSTQYRVGKTHCQA